MAEDSVLITFAADIASYEKAIDQIETKTLGVQKAADDTTKRFSNIGKNANFAPINKGLKDTTQELSKASREAKKTGEELKKTPKESVNGFLKLRNELKTLRGEMAALTAEGKENTDEFKRLAKQAGETQDKMNELGETIKLQSGPPIENFTSSLTDAKQALFSLDFDRVSRGLSIASSQISKISFKDIQSGITGILTSVGKLGAALLTSPIFLVGAAIAGIIAYIATWGDSMEDLAERNDRAIDRILGALDRTNAAYRRQSEELAALGQSTDEVEGRRIRNTISRTKEAIRIRESEIKIFEQGAKKFGEILGVTAEEYLKDNERYQELVKSKIELDEQLLDTFSENRQRNNAKTKEQQDKEQADADKAKAEAEKRAQEILAAQKALQQSQINLLEDGQRKQRQQIRFDFDERIKAIKGFSQAEIDLRKSLELEKQKALDKVAEEQREHKIEQIKLEGKDRARELKQLNDNDLFILNSGARTLEEFNLIQRDKRIQEIAKDVEMYAAFGNSIVSIGQSVSTLLADNAEEAAEKNKLFAAFGIGLNLATSLAQMIAGASAAAAATGPAAPFTLAAYIASGTALVLGAFAQIKTLLSAPPPKGALKGEEYVHGKQHGKDTEHYLLSKGERVVTSAVNSKYWDDLHAMHTGKYEKHINEKRILPALRKAMMNKADSDNESFASNIANSLMLTQGWKGGNIVAQLQRINEHENNRHKELLQALKLKSKPTFRKK